MLNKDVSIVMALWMIQQHTQCFTSIVGVGMSMAHVWEPIHEQILVVCHIA